MIETRRLESVVKKNYKDNEIIFNLNDRKWYVSAVTLSPREN